MSRTISVQDGKAILTKVQRKQLRQAADLLLGLRQVYYSDEARVSRLTDAQAVLMSEAKDEQEAAKADE